MSYRNDTIPFNDYTEWNLERSTGIGWIGIGSYSSKEEALEILDKIRSRELPWQQNTYRLYSINHRGSQAQFYKGNFDQVNSRDGTSYPIDYDMRPMDYRR